MAQALDGLLLDCHSGKVDLIQASGARTAYCIPQKLQPCSLPRIHIHPWTCLILAQLNSSQQLIPQPSAPRLLAQSLEQAAPKALSRCTAQPVVPLGQALRSSWKDPDALERWNRAENPSLYPPSAAPSNWVQSSPGQGPWQPEGSSSTGPRTPGAPWAPPSTHLLPTQSAQPSHSLINYCLQRPWHPHRSLITRQHRIIGREKVFWYF